jgi:sulfur carrier protein ThiS
MKVTITIDGEHQVVELPEETLRDLLAIAKRNGISFAAALQQAIANEKFLEDQQEGDAKLLIEKNGTLRELTREPA